MKNHLKIMLTALIAITMMGCGKDAYDNCDGTAAKYSAVIDVSDSNKAAATFNTSVASFSFTQIIPTTVNQCTPGTTSLKITNTTNQAITIDYVVTVTLNNTKAWDYTSSATLAANATVDVGVINTSNTTFNTNGLSLSIVANTK